jgi:hypothetical protein
MINGCSGFSIVVEIEEGIQFLQSESLPKRSSKRSLKRKKYVEAYPHGFIVDKNTFPLFRRLLASIEYMRFAGLTCE